MGQSCAFCREPKPKNGSEYVKRLEERIDKGDLKAMVNLAGYYTDGKLGLARDNVKALELFQRAADLGSRNALMKLGICFFSGELGVIPNEEKGVAYFKDATKKGDASARHNLGVIEEEGNQRHDLAIRHYKLAAAAGVELSTKRLWKYFSLEKLDKAELEETLRAHKEACDEMNSEERKRYEAWQEALEGNDDTLKNIYAYYYEGLITAKELNMTLKAHASGSTWIWRQGWRPAHHPLDSTRS